LINGLLKEIDALEKKEKKLLNVSKKQNKLKETIYEKVPKGLCATLEAAFSKAFKLVFLKGTQIIEKTFDKEDVSLEFEASDFVINKTGSRKSIKRLDKSARKNNLLNNTATAASGLGLGLLGLGLPDIPLLVSTILKGVYEVSISYGFSYDTDEEKIFILRLLRTALADDESKKIFNTKLDSMEYSNCSLDEEISVTAKVLSDALLVEKFVQGIPIVGIVGGFVNHMVYRKTSVLAGIKYKKRYLYKKLNDFQQRK